MAYSNLAPMKTKFHSPGRAGHSVPAAATGSAIANRNSKIPLALLNRKSKIENRKSKGSSRRFPRCHQYRRQLVRLIQQLFQSAPGHNATLDHQLHPQPRFIRFLLGDRQLACKVCVRPRPACRAVIGCHRSARTQQLITQPSAHKILGQRARQLNHPQSKRLRPLLHLCFSHMFNGRFIIVGSIGGH